jgi:perosamine synthetase
MKSRIYYTKPSITEREIGYATDAAANGWGDKCYEYIQKFEDAFRDHLDVKYAIATSSCTGAMHLGLAGLDIGIDDEVIVPDINWIASVAPVTYLGAKPVLVDVCSDSWCIDPIKVEAAITPKTKAISAVHLYGNLCNMDALLEISERYNLPIIEDAAEAIGSVWHDKRAGSMGKFGVFSFHGTKTITTGEGGMFVTNDELLYEKVLTLSNHGRSKYQTKQFWPDMVGYKYKMSNIQAAIGLAQVERADELIARKRAIFDMYRSRLGHLPISMNLEPKDTVNGYWMPTLVIDPSRLVSRDIILRDFKANNIDGRVFFWPLSSLGLLDCKGSNVVSQTVHANAINLPSYHDMTTDQITRVCDILQIHLQ